ncbi:MAG TPA: phage tail tape measure protein, partial [Acidimicrobiia bacterium]
MADTTVTARFRADTTDLQTKLGALQAQMMATSKRFSSVSQSMVSTGATLTKGVTLPIVAVGTAAVVAGATFEKSMNKVRAVSGATGSDFENMSDTAKELGRTTQFSASQAADGMSFLAMAGFEANDIVSAMPGVLNLAAAGQMDLAQAADIASNVLTGFGMDASELDGAIDVMAKTFTSANTSLDQLGEAMSYVAPIAASAGANFEEVNAAVGLLGNAGIQGSRAGTSLARVMSILTMNSSKTASALDRLGVNALDTSGNLLPLEDIIGQLETSGATTADIMNIFGQRAGPAMAALLSQGSDALRDLTGDLETSGGTAEEIADTQMEGLAGTMLRLKSAFEGAMIAIAESGVLDALTAVVQTAADGLSKFTAIWEKVPGPIKTVTVVLAGVAAAIGPILFVGGKLIMMLGTMGAAWATLNRRVQTATRTIGLRVKTMELEIKTAMIRSQTSMGALGAAAGVLKTKAVVAFRTIGAAAKGLMASFGPIGFALVGA